VLLVMPGFSVNTAWAYEKAAAVLTNREKNSMLEEYIETPNPLKALRERAGNDLEAGVFARFPELERIKVELQRAGAELAALSGSGATVLGIFQDRSRAERAAQLFRDRYKTFIGSPVARERPKPGGVGSAGRV
jgi:4-diphosphocytidyl-2-C-methyl-D-erythritol kinase